MENLFGEKLSIWLSSKNFTQAQLAEELGLSRQVISNIINGRKPSYDFILKLKKKYNAIDLNYLIDSTIKYNHGDIENNRMVAEPQSAYADRLSTIEEKLDLLLNKLSK